jgi:hypothetical protein
MPWRCHIPPGEHRGWRGYVSDLARRGSARFANSTCGQNSERMTLSFRPWCSFWAVSQPVHAKTNHEELLATPRHDYPGLAIHQLQPGFRVTQPFIVRLAKVGNPPDRAISANISISRIAPIPTHWAGRSGFDALRPVDDHATYGLRVPAAAIPRPAAGKLPLSRNQ